MAVENNIRNVSAKLKSGFLPGISYKVYIPKPNGLNRMYTIMPIEDQIVYQAFANKLADQMQIEQVKKRYRKSVFGNLYAGKNSIYFFQKWNDAYKAYTKSIINAFNSGNGYIASFDLTACYDSINHNLLRDILRKFHFSDECIDEFILMLKSWCSPSKDHLLGAGIPQGPQASGIIAEAVLGEYDSYIEILQKQYKFKYFRYVDDIKVLAKDEETVRWVLFLLDKKSKELGMFPQASKVSVHKIENIEDEVKQISKPLFEDEIEEDEKKENAERNIQKLVKSNSKDITSIKRYFQFVIPKSVNNRLALKLIRLHPEMISSFVFYIRRYPRKLPETITNFIFYCLWDKTKQYYAGLLLQVAVDNMPDKVIKEFGIIANSLLNNNKKKKFIYDVLYKEQLYLLLFLCGKYTVKTYINKIKNEPNWWIRQQLISDLVKCNAPDEIVEKVVSRCLMSNNPDEALGAVMQVVIDPAKYNLPKRKMISPVAQEALKQAGIIQRSKYSNSQINKYLECITGEKWSISWKMCLEQDHDNVERLIFVAMTYWRTDLTAFVNLWDTIDDRMLALLTRKHSELGGYSIGNVGGIKNSKNMSIHLPNYLTMVNEIHSLRSESYLSHTQIRNTGVYTGPIPYKEKKRILSLLRNGIGELVKFW